MSYHSAAPLQEAGISIFKSVIYESLRKDVANAIVSLINQVFDNVKLHLTAPS